MPSHTPTHAHALTSGLLLWAMLPLLLACGPVAPAAPGTAIPATAPPTGTTAFARVITNADGGGQFTFAVGQTFSLQLGARRWSQPVGDAQILRALPVPTPAAPDVYRWDYQAVAPGRTDLTTEGVCLPAPPGGVSCMSIELYKNYDHRHPVSAGGLCRVCAANPGAQHAMRGKNRSVGFMRQTN
jgi:hypothetical protein